MRVLHLINNLKREGAQVMVYNLVTSSNIQQVEQVVCVREAGGSLQTALEDAGIPVFAADKYYGLSSSHHSLDFINKIIKDQSIDLVHAHMADAAFLGWRAAKKYALPLVITHHGQDILPNCNRIGRAVFYLLLFFSARYASLNIAVSSSVVDVIHKKLMIGMNKIQLIVNGVRVPSKFNEPKLLDKQTKYPAIVCVGRFVELKGQIQLIEAASIVLKTHHNAIIYLVGDGPLRESLEQKVRSLGLTEKIIFTGSVNNVSEFLDRADIYISTSHYEGLPVATLEAMAWGCPVIASDVPGNNEVVKNDITGTLYSLGNVEELAEKINQCVAGLDKARVCADQAYQMVKQNYNSEFVSKRYKEIYFELVK